MKARMIVGVAATLYIVVAFSADRLGHAVGQSPDDSPPSKKKAQPRRPDGPGRQKWEYSVLSDHQIQKRSEGGQDGLNKLGNEGWELVAVRGGDRGPGSGDLYYFKRAVLPPLGMGGGRAGGFGGVGGFGGDAGFGKGKGGVMRGERRVEGAPAAEPRASAGFSRPEGATKPAFTVFELKHAHATDVMNVLTQLPNSARVIPDARSNCLIVFGTDDQLKTIRELLPVLDKHVPVIAN